MAKAKQRKAKGNNGVGQFVSLTFDTSDPQEAAALAAAQLLASKHGRRKQAVVAFLSALHAVYIETGVLLSPVQIANAVQGVTLAERHAAMGFTNAVSDQTQRTMNGQRRTVDATTRSRARICANGTDRQQGKEGERAGGGQQYA